MFASAWNVKLNDNAVLIAHKAVKHICPVNVVSCDRSIRIDSQGGSMDETRTRVRSIESGNRAFLSSRKP